MSESKEYLYKPKGNIALDRKPLTLKLRIGVLDKLKQIPNWQEVVRGLIEELVAIESDKK